MITPLFTPGTVNATLEFPKNFMAAYPGTGTGFGSRMST